MVGGIPDLVRALTRLDERGYDSAGFAVAGPGFAVRKVAGPSTTLSNKLIDLEFPGHAGIANARWSSSGRPEGRGALPIVWQGVAVVHNGVIENHAALRRDLRAAGHSFETDTDSEVMPHLIADARAAGASPVGAVRTACAQMQGAYAIAVLFADAPDRVLVACCGTPLLVARGAGGTSVASDAAILARLADDYATLEDGDVAELTGQAIRISDREGAPVIRQWRGLGAPDRGAMPVGDGFEYHTRREIAAQPRALRRTDTGLRGLVLPDAVAAAERVLILAAGSAVHAADAARGWIEQFCGLPCEVEAASAWRDRQAPLARGTVAVLVCRTGDNGDTVACQHMLNARDVPTVAVVPPGAPLVREAALTWPVQTGPELGVTATKSFTAQLLALLRFGATLGAARGALDSAGVQAAELAFADAWLVAALTVGAEARFVTIASHIARAEQVIVTGRGWGAALAQEAALKLAQLANVNAVAVPAGELRYGAMAMVRPGVPVLVLASADQNLSKTAANAEQMRARGGHVMALAEASCSVSLGHAVNDIVALPGRGLPQMFAQAVAVQLIAYQTALALGHDVDRPHNLV